MTTSTKRRWFSFSLRTIFVAVTAAGLALSWLTWQMEIVRERKAVLNEITRTVPAELFDCAELEDVSALARITSPRRLLGDQPIYFLSMPASIDPRLLERAERVFPEAILAVTENGTRIAWRDSLSTAVNKRHPNVGTIFKTGLIDK